MFRVVKLSSPNLNYLIIAGAALLYISVIMYTTSAQDLHQHVLQTVLCNVTIYTECAWPNETKHSFP